VKACEASGSLIANQPFLRDAVKADLDEGKESFRLIDERLGKREIRLLFRKILLHKGFNVVGNLCV